MKVSIIIPIYNVSNYIERCLCSVINQTYKNIEIVLVDDATPDDSMIKAAQILERNKKDAKVFVNTVNRGLSAARNTGVKNSTGDYVYFLDSDDELPLTSLERLTSYITTDFNPDVVMGEMMTVGANRKKYSPLLLAEGDILYNQHIIDAFLSGKWYEMACNKLIKRELFFDKNLWFYEGIVHEDNLWSFNLAINASTMIVCQQPTYIYHIHPGTITSNKKKHHFDSMLLIIDEMLNSWKQNRIPAVDNQFYTYLLNLKIFFMKSLLKGKYDTTFVKEEFLKINQLLKNSELKHYKISAGIRLKNWILECILDAKTLKNHPLH